MTSLRSARRAEAAALAQLITTGQQMRRLLERLAHEESLAIELRARAAEEASIWLAGCESYCAASGTRAIARNLVSARRRHARSQ